MAKPKKPKKLKNPKKPRGGTITAMENYLRRLKEVKSENARREREYNSKLKKWKALRAKVKKAK